MNGTNPKFDVVDEDGVKWRVKMGPEAGPETVASRLVWSVGYFANEDYFMPVLHVQKMQRLRRGRNLVSADGTVHNVRLKRHLKDEKKIGDWSWSKNPFTGTPGVVRAPRIDGGHEQLGPEGHQQLHLSDSRRTSRRAIRGERPGSEFRYDRSELACKREIRLLTASRSGSRSISPEFVDFNVPSAPAVNYYINFPEMAQTAQSALARPPHPARECPMDGPSTGATLA